MKMLRQILTLIMLLGVGILIYFITINLIAPTSTPTQKDDYDHYGFYGSYGLGVVKKKTK